jgi:hypothetical protein
MGGAVLNNRTVSQETCTAARNVKRVRAAAITELGLRMNAVNSANSSAVRSMCAVNPLVPQLYSSLE